MKRLSAPLGDSLHRSSEWERERRRLLSKIKPVFMEPVKRKTSCNASRDSKGLIPG